MSGKKASHSPGLSPVKGQEHNFFAELVRVICVILFSVNLGCELKG